MNFILTQNQYNKIYRIDNYIITEQTNTKLYNWFKSVPEDKLNKLFRGFYLKYIPDNPDWVRGILNKFITEYNLSRQDILKIISQKDAVVYLDDAKYKQLMGYLKSSSDVITMALYIQKDSKNELPRIKTTIDAINNSNMPTEDKTNALNKLKSYYEIFSKYSGKIIMSNNTSQYEKYGYDLNNVLSHERVHQLLDVTKNKLYSIIYGICDFKNCNQTRNKEYYSKPDEMYAYLMELRYVMKLQPTDVITNVEITESSDKFLLKIWVSRGGKQLQLPPKILFRDSNIYQTLKCCKTNMGEGLKQLHNSLAKANIQTTTTTA